MIIVGGENVIWVYILTGMLCCLMGVLVEKKHSINLREQLIDLTKDYHRLTDELYTKNQKLYEVTNLQKEGTSDLMKIHNYVVTEKDYLEKLEQVNNHLKTENQGLIRKNKKLENRIKQVKKQNKKIKKENKEVMENTHNTILIDRYKTEINNLHQVILCKNEIIKELKDKIKEVSE